MNITRETLRLFKSVVVEKEGNKEDNSKIIYKTVKEGFIFDSKIINSFNKYELEVLINLVKEEFILNPSQMNSSFHKSWNKIANSSIRQLVVEQIIHYMTTYGFEAYGIYHKDYVFIPREQLNIPEIDIDGINLMIIKGITKTELKEMLMSLLKSGIALSQQTVNDISVIAKYVNFDNIDIKNIKNREVRVILYENLNMIPEDPIEFLRYLVYKCTGKTLLIKDRETIKNIRINVRANPEIYKLFTKYNIENDGFKRLSKIFLRFKPIFLAFKEDVDLKSIINRIRKLSIKYHEPMQKDYMNSVTEIIRNGNFDPEKLKIELKNVNTFRKIRLASAIKYQISDPNSIVYRIRNGKTYSKEYNNTSNNYLLNHDVFSAFNIIGESIISDIRKNVKGKKIYIPENITYALPTSEKNFTGNIPTGTSIYIPNHMIVGVHWTNVNYRRVDLDLSLLDSTGKTGWDGRYRSENCDTLFSGDMTDAPIPHGASELFYIKNNEKTYLLMLNNFNVRDMEVPFKLFLASQNIDVTTLNRNYMVNPNNVISTTKMEISKEQKMLGFIKENKFYFVNSIIGGNSRTSSLKGYTQHTIDYCIESAICSLNLNEVLKHAGAILVDNKEDCDIDLSIEKIEKTTIINLIK